MCTILLLNPVKQDYTLPFNVVLWETKISTKEDPGAEIMKMSSIVNIFHVTGPLWGGIHRLPVDSPHEGQWCSALTFSLICTWTKGWANNRDASDLWCHCTHYDITAISVEDRATLYGFSQLGNNWHILQDFTDMKSHLWNAIWIHKFPKTNPWKRI